VPWVPIPLHSAALDRLTPLPTGVDHFGKQSGSFNGVRGVRAGWVRSLNNLHQAIPPLWGKAVASGRAD